MPADSDLPAPRAWGERHLQNLVRWNEAKKGGHFPALEVPQLLADDIRGFASRHPPVSEPGSACPYCLPTTVGGIVRSIGS